MRYDIEPRRGGTHATHLFPGLSAHRFQYEGAGEVNQQGDAAKVVVVYGGDWPQSRLFSSRQWWDGRSHSFIGSGAGRGVGSNSCFVGKDKFVAVDERAWNEI